MRAPRTVYERWQRAQAERPARNGFEWARGEAGALADNRCAACWGIGLRNGRGGRLRPCGCVLREIFCVCLRRYRWCEAHPEMSRMSLEFVSHRRERILTWGRKNEEYCADFWLVAKRVLDAAHWRIFRLYFVDGWQWRPCCRRLGIDRGNFFHAVYRIEQTLGRVFRELRPYGLFPLDDYFQGRREHGPVELRAGWLGSPHQRKKVLALPGGRRWRHEGRYAMFAETRERAMAAGA